MSNVYIKKKIRSGSYAMEYLRKIRKKRILVVCDKFLAESGAISYILDALDSSNTVDIFDQGHEKRSQTASGHHEVGVGGYLGG